MARKKQETLVLFPEILTVTRKLSDEQFGALMRAAFSYRFNGETYNGDDAAVDVAFQFISNQIDRHAENCTQNAQNASTPPPRGSGMQRNAAECSEIPVDAPNGQRNPPPIQSISNPILSESIPKESTAAKQPHAPAKKTTEKSSFGEFGWVKLTDDEYNRLLNDLGEAEVKRCISYVDESAQTTGNKNRWRDWNLVLLKCHKQGWGLNHQRHSTSKNQPIYGSGELGEAEMEAIQRVLREDTP